jgi:predicted transcriptional regulator
MNELTERQLMAEKMRHEGQTYRSIAKNLDVCTERVRQLLVAAKRKRDWQQQEKDKPVIVIDERYKELSHRALNCIASEPPYNRNITPEELRILVNSGAYRHTPNMGVLTMKHILEWLEKHDA